MLLSKNLIVVLFIITTTMCCLIHLTNGVPVPAPIASPEVVSYIKMNLN